MHSRSDDEVSGVSFTVRCVAFLRHMHVAEAPRVVYACVYLFCLTMVARVRLSAPRLDPRNKLSNRAPKNATPDVALPRPLRGGPRGRRETTSEAEAGAHETRRRDGTPLVDPRCERGGCRPRATVSSRSERVARRVQSGSPGGWCGSGGPRRVGQL